ncbi:MAG: glycosyl hydrolase [Gemmatimonadetes bacterium]|nr:glycosyl hydrolase [Gemmatimonadota bacterium]
MLRSTRILPPLLLALVCGCAKNPAPRSEESGKRPNQYLFRMRAHPKGMMDHRAMARAIVEANAHSKIAYDDRRRWGLVGPTNIGGRITDIALHPQDPDIIYAAAANGGLLRSNDGGSNWTPLHDKFATLAAGSVAVDPLNPETIWLGTGEVNPGGGSATFPGVGILKSTDGGDHWAIKGLEDTRHIGRIVVDPTDSDRVFAATMGALYSTNTERGLYRSIDGGESWTQVLSVNDSTGCIDVVIDPEDPDHLLAATWERIRRPDRRRFGGFGSGVYSSFDGGDSWSLVAGGLPPSAADLGRIGLAIAASDSRIVYAIYADEVGYFDGVYKSNDGGVNWARVNDSALDWVYSSYGWWFGNIRVSPSDPDRVFVLGLDLYRSTNGGDSWGNVGWGVHVDHHGMAISALDPNRLVLGNDGGVYTSSNGGSNWSKKTNLPITQFYSCEIDASNPHRFYGGTQDNGTNRTYTGGVDDWSEILGGDGFYVLVDPSNANYVYAEWQWGNLNRSTNGGSTFSWAKNGINGSDRQNWNAPVALDPSTPTTVYFGTHRVYRSTNRAANWSAISGDLSDGPGTGNLTYGTLTTLAVSPVDGNYIYAGTDDGNVAITRNGGGSWTQVGNDLPDRWVTRVSPGPNDPEVLYVSLSGFKWDQAMSHVYRTTDGGTSWVSIGDALPDVSVNDIIVDPDDSGVLYVATDVGVYTSEMGGIGWRPLGRGLPMGVVMDLKLDVGSRKLAAATFGRSMWSIDLGPASERDYEWSLR